MQRALTLLFRLVVVCILGFVMTGAAVSQDQPAETTPEAAAAETTPEATAEPVVQPPPEITPEPTIEPPVEPTPEATPEPTSEPTAEPTAEATIEPTAEATSEPEITEEPPIVVTPVISDVFQDDFQDGDAAGWTLSPGWQIASEDGSVFLSGANLAAGAGETAAINGVNWAHLLLAARVRVPAGTTLELALRGDRVIALDGGGQVSLYGGGALLAQAGSPAGDGAWHVLNLQALGSQITVGVDGAVLFSYSDIPAVEGAVVFRTGAANSAPVALDDVRINRLDAPAPPPEATPETTPEATSEATAEVVVTEEATPEATPEMEAPPKDDLHPNLDSNLSELYRAKQSGEPYDGLLSVADGRVAVFIVMVDIPSAEAAVAAIPGLGGEVSGHYERWIDALVPVERLPDVAALPGVSVVQMPPPGGPVEASPQIDTAGLSRVFGDVRQDAPTPLPAGGPTNADPSMPAAANSNLALPATISAVINSIYRQGCILTTTFTVGAAGPYYIEIWDDGVKIFQQLYNARQGQRIVHNYRITQPVGQVAPGYGILITSSGYVLAGWDPYDVPTDAAMYCANEIISAGVAYSGANVWHRNGWTGEGVRVGVIDTFGGYTTSQSRGELPSPITIYGTINTGSSHGTSVAEIIYDMAPNVNFVFTTPSNATQMANAIRALADQSAGNPYRVDIISSSYTFYNIDPGDGTGLFESAISYARSQGVLYVQAAGNSGDDNWQGLFRDTDGDSWHEFSPGNEVILINNGLTIPAGAGIFACLRWNDWPLSDDDYDLHLVRRNIGGSWAIVASADGLQTGSQAPTELLAAGTPTSGVYGLAIRNYDASGTHVVDLMGCQSVNFRPNIGQRSLVDPAAPATAFSVAAIRPRSTGYTLNYSSQGPSLGAGGSLDTSTDIDQPRITGYAHVRTLFSSDFSGTSAATPHVSGAAALVKAAYPSYNANQIAAFLEGRAIDIGARGYDHVFGWGRLHMGPPPGVLTMPVITSPLPNAITNDSTPTFNWNGVPYADRYEFQLAVDSAFRVPVQLPSLLPSPTYTAFSMRDGVYFWRVRALRNGFPGPWTAAMRLTIDTAAPGAPRLLLPASGSPTTDTTPAFSWTRPAGAVRFQLQIWRGVTLIHDLNVGNRTSYTLLAAQALGGGTYQWGVRAFDAAGNVSFWSVFNTLYITNLLSPLNARVTTDTTPTFSWRTQPATLYKLEVSDDSGFGTLDYTCTTFGASCTATPLPFGVYYWRVLINGIVQPVVWSLTVTPPPPPAPALIVPISGAINPPLNFSWSSVVGATRYEIQIDTQSTFISPYTRWVSVTTTSYSTSGLSVGTYYWRVRSVNFLNVPGPWSAARRFVLR